MSDLHVTLDGKWKLSDDPKEALLQISKWMSAAIVASENCDDKYGNPDYFKCKVPVEFIYDLQGYSHEAARIATAEAEQ